jgi:hypothetical protein
MKKLVPKHLRTAEFVARDLYNVSSFKELESKIAALESKDERGAALRSLPRHSSLRNKALIRIITGRKGKSRSCFERNSGFREKISVSIAFT